MILPGLVSLAFYRRRPSQRLVVSGLVFTIGASALLGYISPGGPLGQLGSVLVAIAGGVILYFVILVVLYRRYRPRDSEAAPSTPPSASP